MFETQTSRQKKSKIAGDASAAVKLRGDQAILLVAASEGDANMIGPEGQKLFAEKYGYGSPRKDYGFKRWYPEQGLSTYDYANLIDKWNKILLQVSRK